MGKSKGVNHGKSIWSRQMEYAAMRQHERTERSVLRNQTRLTKPPRVVEMPTHIPPTKEQLQTMLHPVNNYRISIREGDKDPIIITRSGRTEIENTISVLGRMRKYLIEKLWVKE